MIYFLAILYLILKAVISSISDDPIKMYCDNSLCGKGPSGALMEFSLNVSPIDIWLTCNGNDVVNYNYFTDFYPAQFCNEVSSYKCDNDAENFVEGLLKQLQAISEFFHSYPTRCSEILQRNKLATSSYYTIQSPTGSLISVFCDMEGSNCDDKGGWMKVGYLNMSEPNATCPSELSLQQFNNIDHGLCSQPMSSSVIYSVHAIPYSKVCGRIRGYQFGLPDAFPPLEATNAIPDIDNCNTYVDSVTITYGSDPRKHIWTYACGVGETIDGNDIFRPYTCPCSTDS